jgi:hypothetical protein
MEFGPTCPTNSVQIARTLSCCAFISPQSHISLPGALLLRKSFERDLRQDFDLFTHFSYNHVHITQSGLLKFARISNYPRDSHDVRATLGHFCNPRHVYLANIFTGLETLAIQHHSPRETSSMSLYREQSFLQVFLPMQESSLPRKKPQVPAHIGPSLARRPRIWFGWPPTLALPLHTAHSPESQSRRV